MVGKASLGKEISKKQVKKIIGRKGESEGRLVNYQSLIYHEVTSPKLDHVSQFEFD